jgi:hypothetical protein
MIAWRSDNNGVLGHGQARTSPLHSAINTTCMGTASGFKYDIRAVRVARSVLRNPLSYDALQCHIMRLPGNVSAGWCLRNQPMCSQFPNPRGCEWQLVVLVRLGIVRDICLLHAMRFAEMY